MVCAVVAGLHTKQQVGLRSRVFAAHQAPVVPIARDLPYHYQAGGPAGMGLLPALLAAMGVDAAVC